MDRPNKHICISCLNSGVKVGENSNDKQTLVPQSSESSTITPRTTEPPIVKSEVKLRNNLETKLAGLELVNQENEMLPLNEDGEIFFAGKYTLEQCRSMSMDNSGDVKLNEKEKEELKTMLQDYEKRIRMADDELRLKKITLDQIRCENDTLTDINYDQMYRDLEIKRNIVLDELQKAKEYAREKMLTKLRFNYLRKVHALLMDHITKCVLITKEYNNIFKKIELENQDKQNENIQSSKKVCKEK